MNRSSKTFFLVVASSVTVGVLAAVSVLIFNRIQTKAERDGRQEPTGATAIIEEASTQERRSGSSTSSFAAGHIVREQLKPPKEVGFLASLRSEGSEPAEDRHLPTPEFNRITPSLSPSAISETDLAPSPAPPPPLARAAEAMERPLEVEFNRIAENPDSPVFNDTDVGDGSATDDEVLLDRALAEPDLRPRDTGYIVGQGVQEPTTQELEEGLPGGPVGEETIGAVGGGGGATVRQPEAPPLTRILLLPASTSAALGQTIQVAVQIDSGLDVSAVPFHVQYDGKVLQFERAYQGDFLSRDGNPPILLVAPLQSKNEVTVGISKTGSGPGMSGSGTLLTLEFRAAGSGTTPLQFSQGKLLNSGRREVPAEFVSSQVAVR